MPWKIIETTDGQHVGEVLLNVEEGQVITFPDGDVVPVMKVFFADEGQTMLASGPHYIMTLKQE